MFSNGKENKNVSNLRDVSSHFESQASPVSLPESEPEPHS